jgi:hypothetical protein
MRAKAPVWHHGRKTRESRVLGCDFFRSRTGKEVKVKNTAKSVVFQVLALGVVNLDVHSLGAGQEYTVSTIPTAVIKVDGVSSVKVGAFWGAVGVTVPKLAQLAWFPAFPIMILTVRV